MGKAGKTDKGMEVRGHPAPIPADHISASVNDAFNAIIAGEARLI